ncbi:isoprenyl transferase [Alphaproteobacteria bacterium]|nr:isoprenyl transferase [Alphaproteobacteria bacterium]
MLRKLKKKQNKSPNLKIPEHIAIIMDGNARWAKTKALPLQMGHKSGAQNLKKISQDCIELGVKILSVYAFSTENWNRPKKEVSYLIKLLEDYLDNQKNDFLKKNIRLTVSGDLTKVEENLRQKIQDISEKTKNNKVLILNVAFSYGSRHEIIEATKKIALAVSNNDIKLEEIDEDLFKKNLYQPDIPDPDLLIRTAGDLRLSNFFLWQAAYTELYFSEVYWPDFAKKNLLEAIENFNQRERRYGKR